MDPGMWSIVVADNWLSWSWSCPFRDG